MHAIPFRCITTAAQPEPTFPAHDLIIYSRFAAEDLKSASRSGKGAPTCTVLDMRLISNNTVTSRVIPYLTMPQSTLMPSLEELVSDTPCIIPVERI